MQSLLAEDNAFLPIIKKAELFCGVSIQSGGYGISWGENLSIADHILYDCGVDVPLSLDDFRQFVANRVVNTAEAAKLLQCSRQNINDLIRRGKLQPLKAMAKNKLFLMSEIMQRNWK